ncbi:Hypothetical protein D9617_30g011360 [Elsinoe fawcettii]|nr:Hypothetical protein D9617_30g011360 [Elsinoe fawcettii]
MTKIVAVVAATLAFMAPFINAASPSDTGVNDAVSPVPTYIPVAGPAFNQSSLSPRAPVLLPEDAGDDDFAFYDELLSNVETRKDVSWIVLKESGIENALSGVAITWENRVKPLTQYTIFKGVYKEYGIPLTEDEQRLDLRYGFLARVARLRKHFDTLSREGTKKPDTWDSRYVDELLPPANATSGDGDKSDMLALLDVQQQKAQELVDQHLRKYNNALAYFRLVKPPKVLSWVPLTKDAWDRTRKIDIKSGNLHGNKDWKAIYSSWDLDGGPTFWTNPSQSEEDAAIELKLLQKSNEDHSKWQDRKKEYLNTLRDKPLKEEEIT